MENDNQSMIEKKLFSDSAGYCQNPSCNTYLFSEAGYKIYHFAEKAHILGRSDKGPRADDKIPKKDRESYENKILLCANCHTIIDKAQSYYSKQLLLSWKNQHISQIYKLFGIKSINNRQEARKYVEPILLENYTIFTEYGPESKFSFDPSSKRGPDTWHEKIIKKILPNNKKLFLFIEKNFFLLNDHEKEQFALFQQHIDDFESKYLLGKDYHLIQFPKDLNLIFT